MAYDALLGSTGPANAPGNPIEAAAITADAGGTKGWVYVGTYRQGVGEFRLAGAFDRTTGDETLTPVVREATDAAGSGAAAIATGTALTATHAANLGSSTANGKVAGTLSDGPYRLGFMTGAGGWVQGYFDVGGTTPSAASVSADFIMTAAAFRQSGR